MSNRSDRHHHHRGYQQHHDDTIYEDLDNSPNRRRGDRAGAMSPPQAAGGYGAVGFHPSNHTHFIDLRPESSPPPQQLTDYSTVVKHARRQLFRDQPIQLSDGNETIVQYKTGQYAKMVMILLFFSLLPFGLCFLAFLPLCTKCKWTKDTDHIDPVSGRCVGRFQRGTIDAPQMIQYYRYPPPAQREQPRLSPPVGNSQARPIPQLIVFGRNPADLPNGTSTIVRKRIGYGNLLCAFITLLVLFFLPIGWVLLPVLTLSCFCLPWLKDTEHLHPQTGDIMGVNYICQS